MTLPDLKPSQRVRVQQTISTRTGPWEISVEGTIISSEPQPTGAWYAHGKNDKLWLHRLRLQKDDGEIVDLILDEESVVNQLAARPA